MCIRDSGTRLDKQKYEEIKDKLPNHIYYDIARIIYVGKKPKQKIGNILVITAGTSDTPIAEEAAVFCELLGNKVNRVYDVGVAGIHRVVEVTPYINKAKVIIVVAGMDGVLPSVIGGLSKVPVIAVPTSVGYGASFKGLSALLTMLNSCAPGVCVVNIDNGFGAGYIASIINKQSK
ncbi:MAG: nickel pincer cofactor biosynthesis protein LarB, partial [Endomicrobia bacterium]|nr:nickel pincer cofactor biosynthesis protein LarB [Endomicrobiia bacterium]